MGVGPRFLRKIVIFMPIWPILSLELGYSGPKQINKSVSRQILCFSPPFLTKIVILCQFDQFRPLKLGKIPFSRTCVGFTGIQCIKRK